MTGFDVALGEVTLVLFTTLAPAGACCWALMVWARWCARRSSGREDFSVQRIDRYMLVPFLVTLVGLVASATHLGNPENALYVLTRVGESPLSTEVAAAVVFLGLAGIWWMYQFAEGRRPAVDRSLLGVSAVCAVALVVAMAFAYNSRTVVTWATPYVPVALILDGMVGGTLLAFATLVWAGWPEVLKRFGRCLLVVCAVALAICTAVYVAQGVHLDQVRNSFTAAAALVPHYGFMVVVFFALGALGLIADWLLLCACAYGLGARARVVATVACMCALAGIFVMRFAFYMMHLTTGMGW